MSESGDLSQRLAHVLVNASTPVLTEQSTTNFSYDYGQGHCYSGEWKRCDGKWIPHGEGVYQIKSPILSATISGSWFNGSLKYGMIMLEGKKYRGTWNDLRLHGKGSIMRKKTVIANGKWVEGNFINDTPSLYNQSNKVKHERKDDLKAINNSEDLKMVTECTSCEEKVSKSAGVECLQGHFLCLSCFQDWVKAKREEGSLIDNQVPCPGSEGDWLLCRQKLPLAQVVTNKALAAVETQKKTSDLAVVKVESEKSEVKLSKKKKKMLKLEEEQKNDIESNKIGDLKLLECTCCGEKVTDSTGVLCPQGHFFCSACFESLVKAQREKGNVTGDHISCPGSESDWVYCREELPLAQAVTNKEKLSKKRREKLKLKEEEKKEIEAMKSEKAGDLKELKLMDPTIFVDNVVKLSERENTMFKMEETKKNGPEATVNGNSQIGGRLKVTECTGCGEKLSNSSGFNCVQGQYFCFSCFEHWVRVKSQKALVTVAAKKGKSYMTAAEAESKNNGVKLSKKKKKMLKMEEEQKKGQDSVKSGKKKNSRKKGSETEESVSKKENVPSRDPSNTIEKNLKETVLNWMICCICGNQYWKELGVVCRNDHFVCSGCLNDLVCEALKNELLVEGLIGCPGSMNDWLKCGDKFSYRQIALSLSDGMFERLIEGVVECRVRREVS